MHKLELTRTIRQLLFHSKQWADALDVIQCRNRVHLSQQRRDEVDRLEALILELLGLPVERG